MKFLDRVKRKLFEVLRIHEWGLNGFDIYKNLAFEEAIARFQVWYRGDSYELYQLHNQIKYSGGSFWGSRESRGMEIRRIHSGLPRLLVNTLTNITTSDIDTFVFDDKKDQDVWDDFMSGFDFKSMLRDATKDVLVTGDGAFKISVDPNLSKYPVIEFYHAGEVELRHSRGFLREIVFYTKYYHKGDLYILEEEYGYGYINYALYHEGKEVPLSELAETQNLEPVRFDDSVLLAVPYVIFNNPTTKGRGESIYEGKCDLFDALDEVVSQWLDALRSGRAKTYIPESLIPRDRNGGFLLHPNAFDNKFIRVEDANAEGSTNKIVTEQAEIPVDAYTETYSTVFDLCIQGLVSPSTLGVDIKKLDNAESQREKEKVTLYTRQTMVTAIRAVLKSLIPAIFNAYTLHNEKGVKDVVFEVNIGEYANPSFEAIVEVLSNPNIPMSVEAVIEELWGDSKTPEWKDEEVQRVLSERGRLSYNEPLFHDLLDFNKTDGEN